MRIDKLRVRNESEMMRFGITRLRSTHISILLPVMADQSHPAFPGAPGACFHAVPEDRPLSPPKSKDPEKNQTIGDGENGSDCPKSQGLELAGILVLVQLTRRRLDGRRHPFRSP